VLWLLTSVILATPAGVTARPPVAHDPALGTVKAGTRDRAILGVTAYADVALRFADGTVQVVKVTAGRFAKPTALPRFRGRFTAIVAHGKKSVVELDFDFPLLADAESPDVTEEARKLGQQIRRGVTSSITVRVPWPEGADTLAIYDSLTHKSVNAPLTSPPASPPRPAPAPAAPAGALRAR